MKKERHCVPIPHIHTVFVYIILALLRTQELTRGQTIGQESIAEFIESTDLPEEAKQYLLQFSPATYIGNAPEQVYQVTGEVEIQPDEE